MALTDVRRRMLMNIRQGKDPYDGFEGSSYGGAVRSMQRMRGVARLVWYDPKFEVWKLTDAGAKALDEETN